MTWRYRRRAGGRRGTASGNEPDSGSESAAHWQAAAAIALKIWRHGFYCHGTPSLAGPSLAKAASGESSESPVGPWLQT